MRMALPSMTLSVPIVGPDVAAWLGGIYIPRLPKIPKMDFRVEGVETDPPIGGNVGHGFFYYDQTWITGFQNAGHLMGNWVGREGQGVQAWTSYWFTPRNKLQFEFRHLKVSHEFIVPRRHPGRRKCPRRFLGGIEL